MVCVFCNKETAVVQKESQISQGSVFYVQWGALWYWKQLLDRSFLAWLFFQDLKIRILRFYCSV
jgi:hypothetical protein